MADDRKEFLKIPVEHISLKDFNPVPLVNFMERMAFQARNLNRAARIYETMLKDKNCTIILCLAGSLISAGLRRIIVEMIENNMVDVIVSTGANLVDQDFLEALGFKHYTSTPHIDDDKLEKLHIDRIYDTLIDEDELRICDETVGKIADSLAPRPYSSREFFEAMGLFLKNEKKGVDSIVYKSYENGVPLFVPAMSDCSAGFGLIHHQERAKKDKKAYVTIDSVQDFFELTKVKIKAGETGLLMIGGGVPKNFTQDIVVAAEVLGNEVSMHKYAVQITVADERDGGLSGSTLKEAHSWGKVEVGSEQMVFSEATITFPLLAGYAFHKKAYDGRPKHRWSDFLNNKNL